MSWHFTLIASMLARDSWYCRSRSDGNALVLCQLELKTALAQDFELHKEDKAAHNAMHAAQCNKRGKPGDVAQTLYENVKRDDHQYYQDKYDKHSVGPRRCPGFPAVRGG